MEATDVLFHLTGSPNVRTAAKVLAHRMRSRMSERLLFHAGVEDIEPPSTPASLSLLMNISRTCGIRRVEFGATIASEGELRPLETGGFAARILRESHTSRARFSLAHEIGHTFFYSHESSPPTRLSPYNRADAFGVDASSSASTEEWFCNEFSFELLIPDEVGLRLFAETSRELSPMELLGAIERINRKYKTSMERTIRKMDETEGIRPNLLIVVLRRTVNMKTGADVAVRVTSSFPKPAQRWYVPRNRRAVSIGLKGADALFSWWHEFPLRESHQGLKSRSGVFSVDKIDGEYVVITNEPMPRSCCRELIVADCKSSLDLPWKRVRVEVPVTYRLYAINVAEAFCIALIDFSEVVPPDQSHPCNRQLELPFC